MSKVEDRNESRIRSKSRRRQASKNRHKADEPYGPQPKSYMQIAFSHTAKVVGAGITVLMLLGIGLGITTAAWSPITALLKQRGFITSAEEEADEIVVDDDDAHGNRETVASLLGNLGMTPATISGVLVGVVSLLLLLLYAWNMKRRNKQRARLFHQGRYHEWKQHEQDLSARGSAYFS